MVRISNAYSKINSLRERYYKAFGGKESLLHMIREAEIPEQVYNSNAIENSTLSLAYPSGGFAHPTLLKSPPLADCG